MDHGEMDHGDMDHGEMAPAGIALASGAEDRDGLEMDVLHLRMGPVLPHWPAGLVLHCSLNGDVLTGGQAWVVGGPPAADSGSGPPDAARQCDHIVGLLTLAGWPRGAGLARRCRDLALDEPPGETAAHLLARLHRSVRRSVLLRWSLRGLGQLGTDRLAQLGLPTTLSGDTYDRLLTRLAAVDDLLAGRTPINPVHVAASALTDALPELVQGLDLAAARLVIASLGIDTGVDAA